MADKTYNSNLEVSARPADGTKRRKAVLFLATLLFVTIGSGLIFMQQPARPQPRTQALSETQIEAEVRAATVPMGTYDFKAARSNLQKLAASHPEAAKSRYYLVNLFSVCAEQNDTNCLRQTAIKIKASGKPGNPWDSGLSDTMKQEIEKNAAK